MQKWEYRHHCGYQDHMNVDVVGIDKMNQLGADGWQCFHVLHLDSEILMWFKRPIESETQKAEREAEREADKAEREADREAEREIHALQREFRLNRARKLSEW